MADNTIPMPPPDLLVEHLWKQFEARIVPERIGEKQRIEMRIFFFAGAEMLFGTVNGLLDSLTSQEADAVLDRVAAELTEFDAELVARLAQNPTGTVQ